MKSNRFLSLVLCAALISVLLPRAALAASEPESFVFDVGEGNIVIAAGTDTGTLKVTYGAPSATTADFPNTQDITITGATTSNTIVVTSGVTANITLSGVDVHVSGCAFGMAGATVNLTLVRSNFFTSGENNAGLLIPAGATLTVGGMGALTATGGSCGAGIGGGNGGTGGSVTINGGTITANGGNSGAGIGGGISASGGSIKINGGTVTANGGVNCAGIGGGNHGVGGSVTIDGGTVVANGGENGAGIGGGTFSSGGMVVISGGTVTANGGAYGAGIGGGAIGGGGTVTISGGSVQAKAGGANAENIGHGSDGSGSGTLTNGFTPVYLTTVTLQGVSAETKVTSLTAALDDVPCAYGIKDMFTDPEGKLHLYLPAGTELTRAGTAAARYEGYILAGSPSASGTLSLDTMKPIVTGITPAGTGVAVSTDTLSITFNEPMNTSVDGFVEVSGAAVSAPQWSNDDQTVTYSLSGLAYETTYVVMVAAFQDATGNEMLPDNTWRGFVTETAPISPPTVTTGTTVTDITASGATVSGSVTADGGAAVTERGFVYGTAANPEIGGASVIKVKKAGTTGEFTAALSGLSANTVYHVRAYATNGEGTSYGADMKFATLFAPEPYSEPDYLFRILTDKATGISVSGTIRKDAALTVRELALGTDAACGAIRAKQADAAYVFLLGKDISLSQDFVGTLTVTIPVNAACNGQTVTVLHCVNGALKTYTAIAENGKAVFTVSSLSPFAAFAAAKVPAKVPNTGGGGFPAWLIPLFLGAACVLLRPRRRT